MRLSNRPGDEGYVEYMKLRERGAIIDVYLNGDWIAASICDDEKGEVFKVSRDADGVPIKYGNFVEYDCLKGIVEIRIT